jgi:hypothetical protein
MINSRRMRLVGHVICMRRMVYAYKMLVGKPEGKRPLGRTRHRWKDNIRMVLREIEVVDWMHLTQDRDQWKALVNTVMNLQVLKKAIS